MALIKVKGRGQDVALDARRNLIYNGGYTSLSKKGNTTQTTTGLGNSGGVYTVDRFSHRRGGTWANAQFSHTRVDASGTGDGLIHALKVQCTTAEQVAVPTGAACYLQAFIWKGVIHIDLV